MTPIDGYVVHVDGVERERDGLDEDQTQHQVVDLEDVTPRDARKV